jgi:signal peptidase II
MDSSSPAGGGAPPPTDDGTPLPTGDGAPPPTDDGPSIELNAASLEVDDGPSIELGAALPEAGAALPEAGATLREVEDEREPLPPPRPPLLAFPDPAAAPFTSHAAGADASWSPSTWLLGITAFLVTVADLGTKEWAKRALATPDLKRTFKHVEVVKDHMDFIFAQNPGGAWSFLRSVPDGLRRPFFLFVSCAAIVFIVTVYKRLDRRQWAMRWGLPLALGGAIGNLADRIRYGWVVDFVDVYAKRPSGELHWPTFNVADIAIVIGVGLMAIDLLSLRRVRTPDAPAAASGAA